MTTLGNARDQQPENTTQNVIALLGVLLTLFLPTLLFPFSDAQQTNIKTAIVGSYIAFAILGILKTPTQNLKKQLWLLAAASPFLLVAIINVRSNLNVTVNDGIKYCIQYMGTIVWIIFLSSVPWNKKLITPIVRVGMVVLILHAISLPFTQVEGGATGLTPNKNTLGALCLFLSFLLSLQRVWDNKTSIFSIWHILPIAILVLAKSRAPLIAIVVSGLVYSIWPAIARTRTRQIIFFTTLSVAIASITYFYTTLENFDTYWEIKDRFANATGQNIYSGRNLIWPILFADISQHPWLGYGSGASANYLLLADSLDVEWSAHNLYLLILVQTGIVGLIALWFLFLNIWTHLKTSTHRQEVRLAAAYFIGLLIHQMFEVALLVEQPQVRFMFWLIPAIGLAASLKPHMHTIARSENERLRASETRQPQYQNPST